MSATNSNENQNSLDDDVLKKKLWLIIGVAGGALFILLLIPIIIITYYSNKRKQREAAAKRDRQLQNMRRITSTKAQSNSELKPMNRSNSFNYQAGNSNKNSYQNIQGVQDVNHDFNLYSYDQQTAMQWEESPQAGFPYYSNDNSRTQQTRQLYGVPPYNLPQQGLPGAQWQQGTNDFYNQVTQNSLKNYQNPLQDRMKFQNNNNNSAATSFHQSNTVQAPAPVVEDETESVPRLQRRNSRVSFVGEIDV